MVPVPYINSTNIASGFYWTWLYFSLQVQIVDGANGHILWKAEFVCPHLVLEASAIQTTMGLSSFLFWASQPLTAKKSPTKTTVSTWLYAEMVMLLGYIV